MTIDHASDFPPPMHVAGMETTASLDLSEFPSEEPWEEHVAETIRHLEARTALYLTIKEAFKTFTVGSDQFIYDDPTNPKRCLAPDVFVVLASNIRDFDSWFVWLRGIPDLAVEIVSEFDRMKLTWEEKFARYQALGVKELVRFNPFVNDSLQIWDRIGSRLVPRVVRSLESYECKTLGLYWLVEMTQLYGAQLRLCRDKEGHDPLPTPDERALRLEEQLAEERQAREIERHERLIAEEKLREETKARTQAEAELEKALAEFERLRSSSR